MIKRVNKLTALLVAATAVTSILPMTAANAATKLETLEGSIQDVHAFNDGKYVYDGYKKDDQQTGVYFFNGTKDTEIEDVDGTGVEYGKDLINYESDDILFNLSNGKAEEDTASDKQSYMETKFKTSVVKKADKYEDTQNIEKVKQINADQFGEAWYEYTVKNDDASKSYTVFINEAAKYVDASETLNVTHYNKAKEKIKFDKFSDLAEKGYVTTTSAAMFSDNEDIYRTVTVTKSDDATDTATYLQKISKAQGESEDGAYLPKDVTTYQLDADTLAALTPAEGIEVRVVKGAIYSVNTKVDGKLTIKKYDLKRVKEDGLDKNKVELDDDYDNVENEDISDFDIDVNGNVWTIYKGEISKVVNGELTVMFTVDRTLDELSVYDDNDVVAWNTKDEIYSVYGKKDAAGTETPVVQAKGWNKNADGTWGFVKADGAKATGWYNDNGTWYNLNASGIMQTGWVKDGSSWYFLNGSGAMKTGWVKDGSSWYFLNGSGAMKTGWVKDGANWYLLSESGTMKTGWVKDGNDWYFLNSDGSMASNTTVGGYKLGSNGAWVK